MRIAASNPEAPGAGTQTFVIRIWSSDGADALRGHIQHVPSRKRACFSTRDHLVNLIQDQLVDAEHDRCQS